METKSKIKKELEFTGELKNVVDVLKIVAVTQFSELTGGIKEIKDHLGREIPIYFSILGDAIPGNVFFEKRDTGGKGKHMVLVVTSDEGFLGDLNVIMVNHALALQGARDGYFYVVGSRAGSLMKEANVDYKEIPPIPRIGDIEYVKKLRDEIIQGYKEGAFSGVSVVYTEFVSFYFHQIKDAGLLPCRGVEIPKKDKISYSDILVEPDQASVLEYLVKLWLDSKLLNIFETSKLSEVSSRIIHLEQSAEELNKMFKGLRLSYFKRVHEASDQVIREIFAARKAKKT